jgi:magnesium chelatase accessory protein
MLLLHGTGASAHSFADVIPPLLNSFTVVVPDLPGHGFTEGASVSSLTLPAIARALDGLLDAIGQPVVALVAGHSAGAPLAIRWTLQRVQHPFAIVGFNPALIAPPAAYVDLIAPLVVPLATSSFIAGIVAQLGSATKMVDRLLKSTGSDIPAAQAACYATLFRQPAHVRGAMGLMAAADLARLLRDAQSLDPLLSLVLGDKDQWVPATRLRRVIAEHFPLAAVETWPGGHLLHEADPLRAAEHLKTTLDAAMNGLRADLGQRSVTQHA